MRVFQHFRSVIPAALVGLVGISLVGFTVQSCGGEARTPPAPSVVTQAAARNPLILISVDTLRSDRLPAYGYPDVETPAIDALRADAILFRHAYANVPLTVPSHVSMLTGLLPPEHGVRDNVGYPFDAAVVPYLPRLLQELGYSTGGAVSVFLLGEDSGFSAGFDFFDGKIESRIALGPGGVQRSGQETLQAALGWLRSVADEPFFFFFHIYEPHTPYSPPEPFASRYASRPYDGEVAFADHIVGELVGFLEELGVYEDAAILLVSDHGEGLGDHGEREHGVLLYRESLQVPMLLKLPRSRQAGTTVEAAAHLVDVHPTLLELAGDRPATGSHASSLLALARDGQEPRRLYAETFYPRLHFGWSDLASLIEYPYHYIAGPDPELYDLAQDPLQTQNVLRLERGVLRRLRDELENYDRRFEPPTQASEEDAEQRVALAALGYLGTTVEVADGDLPDPKAMLPTLALFERGIEQVAHGELAAAVASFEQTVKESPAMVDAWEYLGQTLAQMGRFEPSIDAYEHAFELTGSVRFAVAGARARAATGRWQETLAFIEGHLAVAPEELRLHLLASQAQLFLGRFEEALAAAEKSLQLAPDDADAHYQRGAVQIGRRQLPAAERDLRQAIALAPDHTAAMSDLAMLLKYRGEVGEARQLFERVLQIMPGHPIASQSLEQLGPTR